MVGWLLGWGRIQSDADVDAAEGSRNSRAREIATN